MWKLYREYDLIYKGCVPVSLESYMWGSCQGCDSQSVKS